MATRTAVQSGLWSLASTWDTGIPAAGDTVIIPSGITVTLDKSYTGSNALSTINVTGGTLYCPGNIASTIQLEVTTYIHIEGSEVYGIGEVILGSEDNPVTLKSGAERIKFVGLSETLFHLGQEAQVKVYCDMSVPTLMKATTRAGAGSTTVWVDSDFTFAAGQKVFIPSHGATHTLASGSGSRVLVLDPPLYDTLAQGADIIFLTKPVLLRSQEGGFGTPFGYVFVAPSSARYEIELHGAKLEGKAAFYSTVAGSRDILFDRCSLESAVLWELSGEDGTSINNFRMNGCGVKDWGFFYGIFCQLLDWTTVNSSCFYSASTLTHRCRNISFKDCSFYFDAPLIRESSRIRLDDCRFVFLDPLYDGVYPVVSENSFDCTIDNLVLEGAPSNALLFRACNRIRVNGNMVPSGVQVQQCPVSSRLEFTGGKSWDESHWTSSEMATCAGSSAVFKWVRGDAWVEELTTGGKVIYPFRQVLWETETKRTYQKLDLFHHETQGVERSFAFDAVTPHDFLATVVSLACTTTAPSSGPTLKVVDEIEHWFSGHGTTLLQLTCDAVPMGISTAEGTGSLAAIKRYHAALTPGSPAHVVLERFGLQDKPLHVEAVSLEDVMRANQQVRLRSLVVSPLGHLHTGLEHDGTQLSLVPSSLPRSKRQMLRKSVFVPVVGGISSDGSLLNFEEFLGFGIRVPNTKKKFAIVGACAVPKEMTSGLAPMSVEVIMLGTSLDGFWYGERQAYSVEVAFAKMPTKGLTTHLSSETLVRNSYESFWNYSCFGYETIFPRSEALAAFSKEGIVSSITEEDILFVILYLHKNEEPRSYTAGGLDLVQGFIVHFWGT